MPGSAIHPHLPCVTPSAIHLVIPSGVTRRRNRAVTQSRDPLFSGGELLAPHNDPVITEDLYIPPLRPQPRGRTLPCPRMSNKQVPYPIRRNHAARVQFNPALLREPVHDQQFVEWIIERSNHGFWRTHKDFAAHPKVCPAKVAIHQQTLIRILTQRSRLE